MADEQLKQHIHATLKQIYFSDEDDLVDVSDGPDDSVHLVVVSRKFDGMRLKDKNDLVWKLLYGNLPQEAWERISLAICTSPEEIKAS
jgi:stress-induced morphogen